MEETKNKNGDVSVEFLTATLDGIIRPSNVVHHDVPNKKHGYWRGREVWGGSPESPDSLNKIIDPSRAMIDTKAPFESVKDAVNMFGGNAEWKAHRAHTKERSINIEQELEKTEQEVSLFQKQLEAAEVTRTSALQELELTKKQVKELRLQLQKALPEYTRAQQDSELAQLRVKEIEQGIINEHSVAAKEQLKAVKTRCLEADDELKSIQLELDALKKDCIQLVKERDIATKKSEEAELASKDAERRVEELTVELVAAKEMLESAQSSHLKAEELRLNAAMERERDRHSWEGKMKQSQEELQSFEEKLADVEELKLKFATATDLLTSVKKELASYVQAEVSREAKREFSQSDTSTAAHDELKEVMVSIVKAKKEVNCLRIAASSLKSELEEETSRLSLLEQKEKMGTLTISSLKAKLEKKQSEQDEVEVKEIISREEMKEFPYELQGKTEEADVAKSKALFARQELTKAMEEVELAQASASTMELRLQAVLKEIEAANASEKLALEAIKAIQESEGTTESQQQLVSLPLDEYYALSKRASEAERISHQRMVAAVDQIKDAKRTESLSRQKLEAAYKEIKERKEALKIATQKSDKATEGKLKMEQELRNWRAENEQRRKASEAVSSSSSSSSSGVRFYWKSFDDGRDKTGSNPAAATLRVNSTPILNRHGLASEGGNAGIELRSRTKKPFFPRIVMFLARKKAWSLK